MGTMEPPSTDRIKEDVKELKEWLSATPHLPRVEDEDWLETIHRNCKFRLEKTKSKLDCYYSLKGKHPAILRNRDPTSPELQRARQAVLLAVSERLTNDGQLLIYHQHAADHSLLDAADYFKRIIMVHDVILLDQLAPDGISIVVDFSNFRHQHFLKVIMQMRALLEILVGCYAEKVKAAHLITSSELVVRMVAMISKLTPRKIMERIKLHGASMSNIRLQVDEEVLSSDLGGKGPPLAYSEEKTQQLLEKHREWFQEQDDICADLSKRSKKELKESFKKLEID